MICSKRWPVGLVQLSVTGRPGRGPARSAVHTASAVGRLDALAGPAEAGEIAGRRAGGRQQPHRRRILGDALALAQQHQIVDPRALEVDRALRGAASRSAPAASRRAPSPRLRIACGRSAAGSACGCGIGLALPFSTCTVCGPAVGRNRSDTRLQPSSTSALSTTARIMFWLSFNYGSPRIMEPGRGPGRPTGGSGRCA